MPSTNGNAAAQLQVAAHFARARYALRFRSRRDLEAWQQQRIRRFLRRVVPRAPRYAGLRATRLEDLPYTNKAAMMADFLAYNTRAVGYDEALAVALAAERSRDFAPALRGLTVGLSSGTSGHRGLFLVSPSERLRWAGLALARLLPPFAVRRLLSPWAPPIRIALFLRANSNLYATLASRRIDFRFFDLLAGVEDALQTLEGWQPDAVIAPATVLRELAERSLAGRLRIRPQKLVSVAEVLEESDVAAIRAAFDCPIGQLYQATEGFLGYTCEAGTLHLNEACVHVEPEWIDEERTRFRPVVTDFSREVQVIARYRLDDVLRAAEGSCACGSPERAIAAIEGRDDEVLHLPSARDGAAKAIFPDALRNAMLTAGASLREYAVTARGTHWCVAVAPAAGASEEECRREVAAAVERLCERYGVRQPELAFARWQAPPRGAKRRRIAVQP